MRLLLSSDTYQANAARTHRHVLAEEDESAATHAQAAHDRVSSHPSERALPREPWGEFTVFSPIRHHVTGTALTTPHADVPPTVYFRVCALVVELLQR
jgi:hypothetical protein